MLREEYSQKTRLRVACPPLHGWQANLKRTCAQPVILGLCPKLKSLPFHGWIFISTKIHLWKQGFERNVRTNIYRGLFIGHRSVGDCFVEEQLNNLIAEFIWTKEYVKFYVGKSAGFDTMVPYAIKRCLKRIGKAYNSLILVLPYTVADMEYFEDFYDKIWLPDELHVVRFKLAITKRNELFGNNSDLSTDCLRFAWEQWCGNVP